VDLIISSVPKSVPLPNTREERREKREQRRKAGRRKKKHTSEGGFNPHFFALSHLCNLEIPTEGPYLEVISNTLRISIYQLANPAPRSG
jgi:hypothetical protein